jgi:hypothetical protein
MRYLIQRCAAVVIGFWLCSGSAAAWADWQYTKWGMTEPQVVAASKGAAGRVAPKDVKGGRTGTVNLLSAPYRTGRYEFTAIFAFDGVTRKLATVTLKVINPSDGYGVKSELMGKYGKPTRTSDGTTEWQTDTEVITFIDVWGRSFSVEYSRDQLMRPRGCNDKAGRFAQRLRALVMEVNSADKTSHAFTSSPHHEYRAKRPRRRAN